MVIEREEWETTNEPIKIKELSLATPTSRAAPPLPRPGETGEEREEDKAVKKEEKKDMTPEQAV